MKSEDVEISEGLGQTITVGVLQLKSPFYDEIVMNRGAKGKIFCVDDETEESYRKRIKKIQNIIEELENIDHIDILVLPEYAFLGNDRVLSGGTKSTIQKLEEFSNKNKTIVIGNYYNYDNRASESFVVLPERYTPFCKYVAMKQYHGIKQTVSTYDDDVLKPFDKIKEEDAKVLKFWWAPKGTTTKAYFQILTCKDFLYFTSLKPLREWPDIINLDYPGIIISPISSPEIKPFESRAMALLRDINIKTGVKSIVSILCNAVTINCQTKSKKNTPCICGQSQIISPIDLEREKKPSLKKGNEGLIIATINPFKSIIKPTPTSERESNAVLLSASEYDILESEDDTIKLIETSSSREHMGVVVHPKALKKLGLKKIYGLLRVDDYYKIKDRIQERFKLFENLAIPIHGVYGIHDILTFSYEEFYDSDSGREFLKTRLWPIFEEDAYFDEHHFGCCTVEKVIKYHGIDLKNKEPVLPAYTSEEYEMKKRLREIILGKEVGEEIIKKYKQDNILIETALDTSDISDKEKNEGKLEFLVVIILSSLDRGPQSEGIHDKFEKKFLPYLKNDNRIRTIEKINSEQKGFAEGDYMLHVVGDLADLNDVVIEKIHKLFEKGIGGTRVIIPAEHLSYNNWPSLLEIGRISAIESQIIDIVNKWKKIEKDSERTMQEIMPSTINLLDESTRTLVRSIHYHADTLSKIYLPSNDKWMDDMYSLIYGATSAIGQRKIGLDIVDDTKLYNYCRDFINDIGRAIEKELVEIFYHIGDAYGISEDDIEAIANLATKVVKGREGKFRIDDIEIGTVGYAIESLNGLYTKNKYRTKIEKEFRSVFGEDEEKVKKQKDYLNKICVSMFKRYLFEFDLDDKKYLKSGDISETLLKLFKDHHVSLPSRAKVYKIDEEKWEIKSTVGQYLIEEADDKVKVYLNLITLDMINGLNSFSRGGRNLTSHTEYGKNLHPERILNSTYSGLKFLEKINYEIRR